MDPKGILIAVGGAEDKALDTDEAYSLDFVEEGILSHVVSNAGGPDAKIAVVTSASGIPQKVSDNYRHAFGLLGCQNIEHLHIKSKKEADNPNVVKEFEACDAVMFSGGDQRILSKVFTGSESLKVLKRRYAEEAFVIAGTSAGAVAMSQEMICGGSSELAMLKGAVRMMGGLGFIEEVIFDSHFIRRGRFGRLTEAVAWHPNLLGVGLGEDTGLIITQGNCFQTIGSGMVLLFDASNLTHNSVDQLPDEVPISVCNLTVHVLANGDKFYLREKKIEVLPLKASFV